MKNGHIPSEELSRHLDGFPFEKSTYEEHLKNCEQCAAELKLLEKTVVFIGSRVLIVWSGSDPNCPHIFQVASKITTQKTE